MNNQRNDDIRLMLSFGTFIIVLLTFIFTFCR